ncbi:unnamed protein product [Moneuplotes crassus]|uniref:Uncharacterized protein n=1 Tax=Euplotes crassus TaxID=5936 RepID=A0AAD1X1Z9_EUPCR|nr:unnamed protein product [Moneuplotes crassus]
MSEGLLHESQEVAVPEHVKQFESQVETGSTIVTGVSTSFPAIGLSLGENICILNVPVSPVVDGFLNNPIFTPNCPVLVAEGNSPVTFTVTAPPLEPMLQAIVTVDAKILEQVSNAAAPPEFAVETVIEVGAVITT